MSGRSVRRGRGSGVQPGRSRCHQGERIVPVTGEEPVEKAGVAGREVLVDLLFGYPPVEDSGDFRVSVDRVFLERQLVLVGLRPQPVAEFADCRLAQLVRPYLARQAGFEPATRCLEDRFEMAAGLTSRRSAAICRVLG
jgi:hypothetical protein